MLSCNWFLIPYYLAVDNSDSSSLVASYDRDVNCSCSSLLSLSLALWGILCLLPSILQCSLVVLLVLRYFCLIQLSLFSDYPSNIIYPLPGALQSLLSRVFCISPWDSLSGLYASWDSLSSFLGLWLGRCTLGWPVWPVVGYPLLGVHPSITIARLIMIGYCCNCLDGQLNYWASTQWQISVTIMYWIRNQWLCHSTLRRWSGKGQSFGTQNIERSYISDSGEDSTLHVHCSDFPDNKTLSWYHSFIQMMVWKRPFISDIREESCDSKSLVSL